MLTFKRGLRDGLPIALGYLSVSFAFGLLAIKGGLPIWAPIMTSVSNFTGTGQFVGIDLLIKNSSLTEIAFTVFVINIRYILMSFSLSQKLDCSISVPKRMLIAFGNTDEIFGVAMSKNENLNFKYMIGLILGSYWGWVLGTALGACISTLLPASISSALGIALYAMFIAIIVPPMRRNRPVTIIVAVAIIISALFRYTPFLNKLSSGFVIIIAGVISAAIGAFFFPVTEDKIPVEPPPYKEAD